MSGVWTETATIRGEGSMFDMLTPGHFVINRIKTILGRIPLLFTTVWGDQPAGKVAKNCLEKVSSTK